MNTGQYISGAGHLGLIAYALFGGLFLTAEDKERFATQEVALISEAQFAAMTRDSVPEVVEVAPERAAPEIETQPVPRPAPPQEEQPPQEDPPSEPQTAPADEAAPTPEPLTPPVEALETPPEIQPAELSPEEQGAGVPDIADAKPTPRPVDRVAPEAIVNPEPQPDIADAPTPEVSPDAEEPQDVAEEEPAAAPQESTTQIVTEAQTPSGLSTSPVPQARPAAAARAAQQARQTEQAEPAVVAAQSAADAAAALAAQATAQTPQAPERAVGPPLTRGEKDALRVAVSQCWNVGALSSEAMRTTITVGLSMNKDGTPIAGSLSLLGFEGGSQAGANASYEVARRAILRCGARGFNLPVEKYDHWRNIEMTFDPEQMRFK